MSISVANDPETTSRPRGRGIEKLAFFAAKLRMTGACFWYVLRQIDLSRVLSAIPWLDFRWAAFATLLVMLQIPFFGLRWANIIDASRRAARG
jgi:hypothetical protein